MRDSKQFLNHLPAWSTLQLIPADRIRIFCCSPRGWQGHAVSKSTLSKVDCPPNTDAFHELPRDWLTDTSAYPKPPPGHSIMHLRVAIESQGVRFAKLADVGRLHPTLAWQLSEAEMEGVQDRLSSGVVAAPRGPCVLCESCGEYLRLESLSLPARARPPYTTTKPTCTSFGVAILVRVGVITLKKTEFKNWRK